MFYEFFSGRQQYRTPKTKLLRAGTGAGGRGRGGAVGWVLNEKASQKGSECVHVGTDMREDSANYQLFYIQASQCALEVGLVEAAALEDDPRTRADQAAELEFFALGTLAGGRGGD